MSDDMTQPKTWEPDKDADFDGAVFQALGSASMAWDPIPKGVFDSDWAKTVGDGLLAWIRERYVLTAIPDEEAGCGCWTCVQAHATRIANFPQRLAYASRMIVCPDCGNKRCPRATFHANACTNSNDPEQPGSRYGGLE